MSGRADGRTLDGEKASRIIAAMRESVAERGIAASTFDHVSKRAGVSRGLLHYYFGTKERLLIEVLRRDSGFQMESLDEPLERARTVDEVIGALVSAAANLAQNDPGFYAILFELFVAGRRNPDIRRELGKLYSDARGHVADALRKKEAEGVLKLRVDADVAVAVMFSATDGAVLQRLTDPEVDFAGVLEAAVDVARFLLDARGAGLGD